MATVLSPDSSIDTPSYYPDTSASDYSPRVPRSDSAAADTEAWPVHSYRNCSAAAVAAPARTTVRATARDAPR